MRIFFLLLISVSGFAQHGPKIEFDKKEYNFGDIIQGDTIMHSFVFTNTGSEPLILNNVVTTCGCTATQWPKTPLNAGESAKIQVVFNSTGRFGMQRKIIRIRSNAMEPEVRVYLSGNVLPSSDLY